MLFRMVLNLKSVLKTLTNIMKRRSFIKGTAIASAAVLASTIPEVFSQSKTENTQIAGTIIHSVYFWLRKDLTPQEEKSFLEFFQALKNIPIKKTLTYGKPAPTTTRDATDNTFDYNLIITFDNIDDINVYETHPLHLKAAQKYSKYWERVQVRDTILG